MTCRKKECQ
jgi:hypothetical protein